jgi:uncharacterized membrane protein
MSTKLSTIFVLFVIILSFVLGLYFYPQMPDKMASHWNSKGEVDGHMSKFWGLFLLPVISLGILLLFLLIPKIDPLKRNIERFRGYYNLFIVFIVLFLTYIYGLSIFWNLGITFDMGKYIMPAVGILFFYVGLVLKHAKRNWFFGIRTPWTLTNDLVWEKTNKLGGALFKVSGIIALLGIFVPKYSVWFILVPVLSSSLFAIVYSYVIYQKIVKNENR